MACRLQDKEYSPALRTGGVMAKAITPHPQRVDILCPSDLFIAAFYKVLPIIFEIKINNPK